MVSVKEKKASILRVRDVLDVRTGRVYDSHILLDGLTEQEKHEIRSQHLGNQKLLNYACPVCDQKVYLSGAGPSIEKVYHFKHFPNHGDCPLKDGHDISKEDLRKIMYNGAKESERHKQLKTWLGNFLKGLELHGDFAHVNIEKRRTSQVDKKHWRQPDVSCIYKDSPVVFELQLNNTFVEVIQGREEFYKKEKTFICWLFYGFNPHDTDFSERDIFWLNKSNAFSITEETMRLSEEKGNLLIECHYIDPFIEKNVVKDVWITQLIPFSHLLLKEGYYKPYYFDSDTARQKLVRRLLDDDFRNYIWEGVRKKLDSMQRRDRDRYFLRRFVSELQAQELPEELSLAFVNILDALYFLKTGNAENLNSKLNNIKQFTNQIIQFYPEFGYIYCMAVKKYRPDFNSEQLGEKLQRKVKEFWSEFKSSAREGRPDGQDKSYHPILKLLFPELKDYLCR